MEWSAEHDFLMQNYSKCISHMRFQHQNKRLGLILGAGISQPMGIPPWGELVERIARDPNVEGEALLTSEKNRQSHTSRVQLLVEHFQKKQCNKIKKTTQEEEPLNHGDPRIKKQWQDIICHNLYKTLNLKANEKISSKHPYLASFLDIIRRPPMTVNYNFDDLIERMLSDFNAENSQPLKHGYESVWDINLQFKSSDAIIYHPNGYLSSDPLERGSDWLVFSEDEYADQLIYSMTGYFSSLAHHLSKNTCLLMGLSLEDGTLRHLLRQSARINPGHYHYYVIFENKDQTFSEEQKEAIKSANFEVYNLITLFLTNNRIKALGELINWQDDTNFLFNTEQKRKYITKYCFYITGPIGVGKTSVISYFRNLKTHDEWTERRPSELAKDSETLNTEEKDKSDKWIADQFNQKNHKLFIARESIHIIDRTPLDPFAFTPAEERSSKAAFLLKEVCKNGETPIVPGRVILLKASPNVLVFRLKPAQRTYTVARLKKQQEILLEIYENMDGVTIIDTTTLSLKEVVKRIARIIHMENYKLAGIHEKLKEIAGGSLK